MPNGMLLTKFNSAEMTALKTFYLIDAYALIYRSYYAFIKNPRYNSKGLNTSASFGFVNTLIDIIKNRKPDYLAVAFDLSGPTFRHQMYPQYKANRQETPEDIKISIPIIRNLLQAFQIPIVEMPGFEADDVIGTLAKLGETKNMDVFMITPDKDYCQLVSEKINIIKPKSFSSEYEVLSNKDILQKFEISDPVQFIDILALMGDTSDNVPGAPGIGEKTAMKLISQYNNIENLFQNIQNLKGKQKEIIEQYKDQILLSRKLVTIDINVPGNWDVDEFVCKPPQTEKLKAILEELEFKTVIKRLFDSVPTPVSYAPVQASLFDLPEVQAPEPSHLDSIENTEHNYVLLDDLQKIRDFVTEVGTPEVLCFDTETTGLDVHSAELVGLSFSVKEGQAFYIPVPANAEQAKQILDILKPVLENSEIKKTGQNIKFDYQILLRYNIVVRGLYFDTMVAHYLLQPELKHNLDFLAEIYLNYKKVTTESLIGEKGKNQGNMRQVSLDKIKDYACEDADITFRLYQKLKREFNTGKLQFLLNDIEMPLVEVLAGMENAGVKIDKKALDAYAEDLRTEILKMESEIFQLAGMEFNIASPKQLGEVLYERLKIGNDPELTKTKQFSTSEETLEKLHDKHPIIAQILEYRSFRKLLSTYVEALPKLIHPLTGRVHTSYNQTITATGRLSSTNPNLQNIPIRDDKGKEIRKAFIPGGSDFILFSADYSQIELRLMAHLSQDVGMIEAFSQNRDIHAETASKIFKLPLNEVSKDMRRQAKTANFGIIYGISSFGLSQRLKISRSEAKSLIDKYFENYPMVKTFMDSNIREARSKGYVETMFGRKRYLPDINSRNATVRGLAERNAINAPIQGSAADIIKIAMVQIQNEFKNLNLKSRMILQVHDELIFDVFIPEKEIVQKIVTQKMESAAKISVPLLVEGGFGQNWLEAH